MDENDTGRALFLFAAVGLSMVALITAKTGRDAVFLSASDIKDLPLAYLLITLVSVPSAMLHLKAMRNGGLGLPAFV